MVSKGMALPSTSTPNCTPNRDIDGPTADGEYHAQASSIVNNDEDDGNDQGVNVDGIHTHEGATSLDEAETKSSLSEKPFSISENDDADDADDANEADDSDEADEAEDAKEAAVVVVGCDGLGKDGNSEHRAGKQQHAKHPDGENGSLSTSECSSAGRFCDSDGYSKDGTQGHDECRRPPDPWSGASAFSRMLFLWASPLLRVGSTRTLEEVDLPDLPPEGTSSHCRSVVYGLWMREKEGHGNKPSLLRAIGWHYVRSMAFAQILLVLSMAARIGQALALGLLLEQFENDGASVSERKWGYLWTGVIALCGVVLFLSKQRQFFETYRGGMRLRIGLIGVIFEKTLKLSSIGGVYDHTSGQVINLASNDVERFVTASVNAVYLIWGPIEALVILVVGIRIIGLSFAAGYLLLLLFLPLQFYLSKRFAFLRSKVASMTDTRVNNVSQAVSGSRVMKMNSWENLFLDKILAAREMEVRQILISSRYKALNEAIYFCSNVMVSVLIFSVHVITGGTLTPSNVYSIMALLNILQFAVAKQIPSAIMGVAECYVSCKRIQRFLDARDLPSVSFYPSQPDGMKVKEESLPTEEIFTLTGATCFWNGLHVPVLKQEVATETKHSLESLGDSSLSSNALVVALRDVTLRLEKAELYAIVGKVGSGKSALLQTIAGELPLSSGKIERKYTKMAYAPQSPWIMNGSIRENILMGLAYNEKWYRKAVASCALNVDFSRLSHRDMTIVGDRGVQLSGGQRARIGLARALYVDADMLLLDDPLSAVDSKVGRSVFLKAIRELGVDRGKCVVLATHQYQYVGDRPCILMEDGRIACQGSYKDCAKASNGMLDATLHKEIECNGTTLSHDSDQAEKSLTVDDASASATNHAPLKDSEQKEDRMRGIVKRETWDAYARAMGGVWVGFGLLAFFVITQACSLVTIVFMGKWAEAPPEEQLSRYWLVLNAGLAIGTALLSIVRARLSFSCCIKASQNLHDRMTRAVLRAKIEFFDTNPVGRILNRFSADTGITDELLPLTIYDFTVGIFIAIGSVATAIVVMPFILLALPPLAWCFMRLRRIFVATTRELKRLEGLGRSPLYAMLNEALNGIAAIRSNGKVLFFREKFEDLQNAHTRAFFAFVASSRWFAIRIDMIACTLISLASLLAVLFNDQGWLNVEPAVLGLALTMLMKLAGTNFPWIIRQSAEVVNQMVSTERMAYFGSLPSEAELIKHESDGLLRQAGWPNAGAIEAKNLTVRYRQSLPLSLNVVSFCIKSGHRVGVVGRTGSGKSTLVQSLFRLLEAEKGCIMIDDVDISKVGLHTLRSKMSIIPQSPTLYSGCTIRENLDPFSKYSDEDINNALSDVQMETVVRELSNGLDCMLSEEGTNFSVGQRQLLCLARAILRQNKILILDEPTANVDRRTDQLLQEALQRNFRYATILSVAHRLETVIDFDAILVLGDGQVIEYGHPLDLLSHHGPFASMVDDTGAAMSRMLRQKISGEYTKKPS